MAAAGLTVVGLSAGLYFAGREELPTPSEPSAKQQPAPAKVGKQEAAALLYAAAVPPRTSANVLYAVWAPGCIAAAAAQQQLTAGRESIAVFFVVAGF